MAALHRMYERAGFTVLETSTEHSTAVCVAQKPADSIAPRLEQALRRAALALDGPALEDAALELGHTADALRARLDLLLAELRGTPPGLERFAVVQRIRRLVRG
jgi:hypothetical protein